MSYSELRNEALHEVLKIGRERYGIDLLKKNWRQAVDNLRLRHPGMSIGCLSGLFGKSREGYYSVSMERRKRKEISEQEIVNTVRDIRKQAPGIGSYKLFLILRNLYPVEMRGRDWFYRLMHENGLMLKPPRRRHTTNSNHNFHKHKNIAKGMSLTGANQLWVADITYIDTDSGVVYLHLLTDAFTHEIIGWTLSESLVASNTVAALDMGIKNVSYLGLEGLVHHSDRGIQYCCNMYIERLNSINASVSMTEDYKPTDNAVAERVNGILKQEWLYKMKWPGSIEEARDMLAKAIEFYNTIRPHMSNRDMLPPRRLRDMLAMK